ncbi:BREX system P-loop protein BrxC [Pseudarthrobacter sp. MDT3-26]|uniref:BREX system P-loop protein BrxC n=1 Tax=Pseudarthrobacter raffinosi TaxID=2953651 RepID=UPI00208E94EB|nr:BREX system P-loop protein BrxC [Pseudarthrobacter sp. MDT3-26]MCO4261480.1 BREX system P-loop protein BrxC [Pseudarthrobacter sp. MDT3-26]
MTINYEVFSKDPRTSEIPNTGVSKLLPPQSEAEWSVLRYELTSFVCEGEYERGLDRILGSYLEHLSRPEQPAVWVSGFFGSGKSHMVRVLEYLWTDSVMPDGASPRGLTRVSSQITNHFTELTTAAKRAGTPLWSAAGTLGTGGAEDIELAFLSIIYQAAGLPTKIGPARCALWLKSEGLFDSVAKTLKDQSRDVDAELRNLYVSRALADAVLVHSPGQASDATELLKQLRMNFPDKAALTIDEFVEQVREVLETVSGVHGTTPLTLIVLDELQQYINDDAAKALKVQHLVEACSSRFDSKVLVVATGQSAMTGNQILQKIVDRFGVQVELKTQDVDTVVRQVVLKKDPARTNEIKIALDTASGEISRELAGAKIQHRESDDRSLIVDYPLLPSRRQFWAGVLSNADMSGKGGQLRSQLRVISEANQHVSEERLGTVVGADFIYEAIAGSMRSSGKLPRDTQSLIDDERLGSDDGPLRARVLATVFLIGLLPTSGFHDTGVRPSAEHIADLLVEDLNESGSWLRKDVPRILATLVEEGKLQQISGEYRIQTPEGQDWDQDYRARKSALIGDAGRVAMLRDDAFAAAVTALLPARVLHGQTKAPRQLAVVYGTLPDAGDDSIPVGAVTGWAVTEKQFMDQLKGWGTESSLVGAYLPQISPDDFRDALATYHAAKEAIEVRPQPSTDEGRLAKRSVESVRDSAKERLDALVAEVLDGASVVQAGGSRAEGATLKAKVEWAALRAADRLFPQFSLADNPAWSKVVDRARGGNTAALEAVGYTGDANKHPVAKLVFEALNSTWTVGSAILSKFSRAPYGWPKDAINGAIFALLVSGDIRAQVSGKDAAAPSIPTTGVGAASYIRESISIGVQERIGARKTLALAGITCAPGEEAASATLLVERLSTRAVSLSGDAPLPVIAIPSQIVQLGALHGNELLLGLSKSTETVDAFVALLDTLKARREDRTGKWQLAERLARHEVQLHGAPAVVGNLEAIRASRSLLEDQDPVGPTVIELADALRGELKLAYSEYESEFNARLAALTTDTVWESIDGTAAAKILAQNHLLRASEPSVATPKDVADALDIAPLETWADRKAALGGRFEKARTEAILLTIPQAKKIALPAATLSNSDDVDAYVERVRAHLLSELASNTSIVI